jgi:peptidoglycan/xylan/chitin deacetylase (PgdA/CDA1 family)
MRIIRLFLVTLCLFLSGTSFAGPKIILKLDDFQASKNSSQAIPILDYLIKRQIKAGFGAVAGRCDSTAYGVLKKYLDATNRKGEQLFEVWNHGLEHVNPEFKERTYEYQKDHFEKADELIRKYLGIQMHSFGTPFNANDSIIFRVVSENPNYKIFMFARNAPTSLTGFKVLNNRVNMENGTGNPEYDFFVTNYNKDKVRFKDYMILQGHPNKWNEQQFEQFGRILDFLIADGCEFVLPYEYYRSMSIK